MGGSGGAGGASIGTDGAQLYGALCAECHGLEGQGAVGPALTGWSGPEREALITRIDETMPTVDPALCAGLCARSVAEHILAGFPALEPERCEGITPPPRRLRRLTRRELSQTLQDLFAPEAQTACTGDAQCDARTERCLEGQCAPLPCGQVAFVWDPQGQQVGAVHVAGEFNDWAPTVADGGWPMTFEAERGLWMTRQPLAPGVYAYKFVIEEQEWIADPANPEGVDDHFGGQNSVLRVECAAGGSAPGSALAGLAEALPPETRPAGFGYDTYADAARVGPVWFEEALAVGEAVVATALPDDAALDAFTGCGGPPDASCARRFVARFGRRVFRRALTESELARYSALITEDEEPRAGARTLIQALLASPQFLYRSELGEPTAEAERWRLTEDEIATALAYTFLGTGPDEALLAAAEAGELSAAEGRVAQARRLLARPRARDQIGAFALQWLGVESVSSVEKADRLFPDFTDEVRQAMVEETRRFVAEVALEGGRFDDLLTAEFTWLNGPLAQFYGVAPPEGVGHQRVAWADGRRAGVLGQGSVLVTYAHSDQTSPIRRGLFVRERLLCQHLPAPPADAGGVPEVDPNATTRERYRQHTENETCYTCHRYIDDVGFGFEHFDPVGRWRDREGDQPIDARGDMNDVEGLGTDTRAPYEGLPELGALLAGSARTRQCFAAQVYRFSYGRTETGADRCTVAALESAFVEGDIEALLIALVETEAFVLRGPESPEEGE